MTTINTQAEFDALTKITQHVELHDHFSLTRTLNVTGDGRLIVTGDGRLNVTSTGRLIVTEYGTIAVTSTGWLAVSGGGRLDVNGAGRLAVNGYGRLDVAGYGRLDVTGAGRLDVFGYGRLAMFGGGRLDVACAGSLDVSGDGRLYVAGNGRINVCGAGRINVDGTTIAMGDQARGNLQTIAPLALADECLNMTEVHACETVHCIAGWACHSLPGGRDLETRHGWYTAGLVLLGVDAAQHFYDSHGDARQWLSQYLIRRRQ